ncbi:hypothetical protein AMAG_14922 [Allomyces macrogynus ATCC 38327]|uniref:Ribosomal protein L9 domain-containing protein n=2 Tax=Allomyces macrogynus (strain ATCC 38327) TaxID=578462 RepID=A0A0L0T7Y1_ALLM3|nr:hypothetical protein AMAG_14922 [Allomyces macrogynus ATCC 38327]|eukprot:KNE70806.1 hypothetical protein AMAG_14922 [Allomyces macrogynus ATCC 38327]
MFKPPTTLIASMAAASRPSMIPLQMPRRLRHSTNLYATILSEDVKNVGKAGEIVMLSAGFARNFVMGTKKGLMIPRDQRGFRAHKAVYQALGYPVATIQAYYDGKITPKSKGESYKTSVLDALSTASAPGDSDGTPTVMKMLQLRKDVAAALQERLATVGPISIQAAADESGALYGSVATQAVYDQLLTLHVPGFDLVIKHADQIHFRVKDEGKVRKLKTTGTFDANVAVPMVGNVPIKVQVLPLVAPMDRRGRRQRYEQADMESAARAEDTAAEEVIAAEVQIAPAEQEQQQQQQEQLSTSSESEASEVPKSA